MRLVHPRIEKHFEFVDNIVNVLVVEVQQLMTELIIELQEQVSGREGRFRLVDNEKEIKLSKRLHLVIDCFNLDINNRQLINQLMKEVDSVTNDERLYLETQELKNKIEKYIYELEQMIDYNINFNQNFTITELLKGIKFNYDNENMNFIEMIIEYIKIVSRLLNVDVFVFINLKSFLSKEQVQGLYEYCAYSKINLLLIESHEDEHVYIQEKVVVIDKDLCEIWYN